MEKESNESTELSAVIMMHIVLRLLASKKDIDILSNTGHLCSRSLENGQLQSFL